MLAKVKLNLAGRQLVSRVVSEVKEINVHTSRTIRDIYRSLRLRDAEKEVEDLSAEMKAVGRQVTWSDLAEAGAEEYKVEGVSLRWLRDQLDNKNWNKSPGPNGQDVDAPVPASMAVEIADLMDAVLDALGIEDEGVD